MLLVILSWVSCDGLVCHPGGSSDAPSCIMLGIPVMDWRPIEGIEVMLLVTLCWVSCDRLVSHPGGE